MTRPRDVLAVLCVLLAVAGCMDGGRADGADTPTPSPQAEVVPGAAQVDTVNSAPAPGETPRSTIGAEERAAIQQAVRDFVRTRSALADFSVVVDAVAQGHARARVIPSEQVTDPATVFLRREGGVWRGLVIGTAFAPEEYDSLRIPRSLRPGG